MNFRLSKVSHLYLLPHCAAEFQVLVVNNPFSRQRLQAKLIQQLQLGAFHVPFAMMCKYLNRNVWMCEYGFIQ